MAPTASSARVPWILAALLAGAAGLPAQGPLLLEWRLAPQDFAWYEAERSELRRSLGADGAPKEERVRFAVTQPALGVFGHEVSGKPGHFQTADLLLLPCSVGLALPGGEPRIEKRRAIHWFFALGDYGRVCVEGEWVNERIEDGKIRQRGSFALSQPKGRVAAEGRESAWTPPRRSLAGMALELERLVDGREGRILLLKSSLAGSTRPWDGPSGREETPLAIQDTYTFQKIYGHRYPEFEAEVREAIQGGLRQLRWEMGHEHRFAPADPANKRDFRPGFVALALLTLRKADVPGNDPLVLKCLDYLRANPVQNTYSLGTGLMALEAHYAPPGEREMLIEGQIERPFERSPSPQDRRLMEGWVQTLCGLVDPRTDRGYLSRWRYEGEQDFDNSNTQYAVLGLHSASLCGLDVPGRLLQGAAAHFIQEQERTGEMVPLPALVTHQELARMAREGRSLARRTTVKVPARGFSYHARGYPTGSMTAAGIATLSIAAAMVPAPARSGKAWTNLGASLREAYAWLHSEFSARENPLAGQSWYHYYLYGLERAMELNSIARLGERDWYWEGALHLLRSRTAPQGGWHGAESNCFAVLFLKKAQLPVSTGRPPSR